MPPDTADYITAQRLPRRFVIIDEYQDISASRQGLVRTMRDQAGFRLFCVGAALSDGVAEPLPRTRIERVGPPLLTGGAEYPACIALMPDDGILEHEICL